MEARKNWKCMATIKQKRAFDRAVENGGVVSTAMVEVGYSENTAKTPQKLTESRGWQELMDEYMPDTQLAQVHQKWMLDEDGHISLKAVDMAYKLKGSYAPEKTQSLTLTADLKDIDRFTELRDKYEAELLNTIQDETGEPINPRLDTAVQD